MSVPLASEQEWNRIRNAFSVSLMAETSLSALAQNIEAGDWPIDGADETPSKYIVYSWEELRQLPQFERSPILLELLLRILHETLSFDEPFQDMVEASQKSIAEEFSGIKTLKKLEIPEEFPIALTSLSTEAKDLCKSQGLHTLGEYVRLSQKISQMIIMEGDFRAFLNAITHLDEHTIARFLPYRPGCKGLHLAEAIGSLLRGVPKAEIYALAKSCGYKMLNPDQSSLASAVSKQRLGEIQSEFRAAFGERLLWFKTEAAEWRANQSGNESIAYRLRVLNDPILEFVALALVAEYFPHSQISPVAVKSAPAGETTADAVEEKPSFWERLLRIFKG
jgi:hypothetical protein